MDICHIKEWGGAVGKKPPDLSVAQVLDAAVEVSGLADRGDHQGPVDLLHKAGQTRAQAGRGHLLQVRTLFS